jgi:hypothetical protein
MRRSRKLIHPLLSCVGLSFRFVCIWFIYLLMRSGFARLVSHMIKMSPAYLVFYLLIYFVSRSWLICKSSRCCRSISVLHLRVVNQWILLFLAGRSCFGKWNNCVSFIKVVICCVIWVSLLFRSIYCVIVSVSSMGMLTHRSFMSYVSSLWGLFNFNFVKFNRSHSVVLHHSNSVIFSLQTRQFVILWQTVVFVDWILHC